MRHLALFVLLSMLCASCSSSVSPETSTPAISHTPAATIPGRTADAGQSLTATVDWANFQVTLSALKTPGLLITATPDPTIPIPVIPTRRTLPSKTEIAVKTLAAFPKLCQSPMSRYLSPDGNWAGYMCLGEEPGERQITVIGSFDQRYRWKLIYGKTVDPMIKGADGYIKPYHWASDGRYLYLSYSVSGDGGTFLYFNGQGLIRLDLISGDVTEVIPFGWYAFSFSPKDNLLVFARNLHPPLMLQILNLTNGQIQKYVVDAKYVEAGKFVWLDDQKSLFFMAAGEEPVENRQALFRLNLENQQVLLLRDSIPIALSLLEYRPDQKLIFTDQYGSENPIYEFDLVTKDLVPVRAMP